jgi:glucuronoarabinoxylan endo-1,4-beta-xylanase
MKHYVRTIISLLLFAIGSFSATAQNTVRIDATKKHQRITGFGGFVCSPQFQYNHMSTTEIKKVWGETSTVGCNIMRLYIPIGENAWSQSLATAKTAKQMGLIVFASPWGQPAEWKTNGTSNAMNEDGTLGYLKQENWADYAQYLEKYVQYLRKNGVELDAISIQNEPDWHAKYAGCMWSATDIANFVKTY